MSYQVLARKWRPQNFKQMVGQEHVLKALIHALESQRLHHAYLFTGTRGVGKTTIGRILAKCLSCHNGITAEPCGQCGACTGIVEGRYVDLIEIDAASRTKVEDMRELLENVQYAPSEGRYKIYLIDEVHMLSTSSFNALLKTLEEPPEHVKFLFATTDPQKLPVTILSRCLQFNLKNMSPERIVEHLKHILQEESVGFEEPALWALARAADGSMRDALSLTDQAIAYGNSQLMEDGVSAMLGTVDQKRIYRILDALVANDAQSMMSEVAALSEFSPDYSAVLASLLSIVHRIAIEQAVPGATDNAMGDQSAVQAYAQQLTPEDVQLFYQIALVSRKDLSISPDPRAGLEMALLRMLAFQLERPEQAPSQSLNNSSQSQLVQDQAVQGQPAQNQASDGSAIENNAIENNVSVNSELSAASVYSSNSDSAYSEPASAAATTPTPSTSPSIVSTPTSGSEPVPEPVPPAHVNQGLDTYNQKASVPTAPSDSRPVDTPLSDQAPAFESVPLEAYEQAASMADNEHDISNAELDTGKKKTELNAAQAQNAPSSVDNPHVQQGAVKSGSQAPAQGHVNASEQVSVATGVEPESFAQASVESSTSQSDIDIGQASTQVSSVVATGAVESNIANQSAAAKSTPEQNIAEQGIAMPDTVSSVSHLQAAQDAELAWPQEAAAMGLTGMTQNLLLNMFKAQQGERVQLYVESGHFRLLNKVHESRIIDAFKARLGAACEVVFTEGLQVGQETPMMWRERRQAERLVEAKHAVRQDPNVIQLLEVFDAVLLEDSVEALGELS